MNCLNRMNDKISNGEFGISVAVKDLTRKDLCIWRYFGLGKLDAKRMFNK